MTLMNKYCMVAIWSLNTLFFYKLEHKICRLLLSPKAEESSPIYSVFYCTERFNQNSAPFHYLFSLPSATGNIKYKKYSTSSYLSVLTQHLQLLRPTNTLSKKDGLYPPIQDKPFQITKLHPSIEQEMSRDKPSP